MSVRQFEGSAVSRRSPTLPAGHGSTRGRPRSIPHVAWWTAAVMLAVVGGVYLFQQHWTHLAGNWVYLVLLACPLMHLLMDHGQGGNSGHQAHHAERDEHSRTPDRSSPPVP